MVGVETSGMHPESIDVNSEVVFPQYTPFYTPSELIKCIQGAFPYLPEVPEQHNCILLYGSRADGRHHEFSDLDLLVSGAILDIDRLPYANALSAYLIREGWSDHSIYALASCSIPMSGLALTEENIRAKQEWGEYFIGQHQVFLVRPDDYERIVLES